MARACASEHMIEDNIQFTVDSTKFIFTSKVKVWQPKAYF